MLIYTVPIHNAISGCGSRVYVTCVLTTLVLHYDKVIQRYVYICDEIDCSNSVSHILFVYIVDYTVIPNISVCSNVRLKIITTYGN